MTFPASLPRGPWRKTPWLLRLFGKPAYMRSVYANWRAGGGWDGWEYSDNPDVEHHQRSAA